MPARQMRLFGRSHSHLVVKAGLAGIVIVILTLIAVPLSQSLAKSSVGRKPNIILILADDLGYGDLSSYDKKHGVPTPHIDSLGKSGMRFTDAHVSAAVCAPSRAGLNTGRVGVRHGSEFNRGRGVAQDEKTLGELMKEAGYATGMIGKWHMGDKEGRDPLQQGYDEFFGFYFATNLYIAVNDPEAISGFGTGGEFDLKTGTRPRSIESEKLGRKEEFITSIIRGDQPVDEREYLTDALTREAVAFIERRKDSPFFLNLAYNAPHEPYQTTRKYYDRFPDIKDKDKRIHAAMISALDDGVGQVLAKLKKEGLDKNTIVVFLSDNGCPDYSTESCSNGPLRGWKSYHLEGGQRVPFFMSWPARLPGGKLYEKPVSSLDLYTTFSAVGGGKLPQDRVIDGVDLMPYLAGKNNTAPHPELYWRAGANFAVREGDWKLVVVNKTNVEAFLDLEAGEGGTKSKRPPYPGISPLGQYEMLYDLKKDPGEKTNLAKAHPEIVARLRQKFVTWNKDNTATNIKESTGAPTVIDGEILELVF